MITPQNCLTQSRSQKPGIRLQTWDKMTAFIVFCCILPSPGCLNNTHPNIDPQWGSKAHCINIGLCYDLWPALSKRCYRSALNTVIITKFLRVLIWMDTINLNHTHNTHLLYIWSMIRQHSCCFMDGEIAITCVILELNYPMCCRMGEREREIRGIVGND